MKREIIATIIITLVVLRGLLSTLIDVKHNKVAANPDVVGYSEIIDQDLIFADEFNNSINDNWQIQDNQTKYNRLSTNMAANVQLTDNEHLKLTTKQEADGSITTPYMTVSEDDNGDSFNYGYYEVRARFTNHNNIDDDSDLLPGTNILKPWGAFWMYPIEDGASEGTEIDVVENSTAGNATSSLHELDNYQVIEESEASSWFKGYNYQVEPSVFHRYGVYIEPNETENSADYTFYLNGRKQATVTSTHPLANQTIHLSMEIATADYIDGKQGKPIEEITDLKDESMIVDYVRVYEYNPSL